MDLFDIIFTAFAIESKTVSELVSISSLIDQEKQQNGRLLNSSDPLSITACVIVALLNEKSTAAVGQAIYSRINELIVEKNMIAVSSANNGQAVSSPTSTATGIYKILKTATGFKFILTSPSGRILAASEAYSKIDSCINGIESFRRHSHSNIEDQTIQFAASITNPKYELYLDHAANFRFRLKAKNGEILAVSEPYTSKETCLKALNDTFLYSQSNDIQKA